MKNYLLNFRRIKLFHFVISIWLIGSCSAYGQGWVKNFGKYKFVLTTFKYNDNIGIISEEATANDTIIYLIELDEKGNQLNKFSLFNQSKYFNLKYRNIDNEIQFLVELYKENKVQLYKLNNEKVELIKEFLNSTTPDNNNICDDFQFCLSPSNSSDSLYHIDKNGEIINQIDGVKCGIYRTSLIKYFDDFVISIKDSIYNYGIAKFDYNCNILWNNNHFLNGENKKIQSFLNFFINTDSSINIFYIANNYKLYNTKIDKNGNTIYTKDIPHNLSLIISEWSIARKINNITILGLADEVMLGKPPRIIVLDSSQNVIYSGFNKELLRFSFIFDIKLIDDYLIIVGCEVDRYNNRYGIVAKTTLYSTLNSNALVSKFYVDEDKNCIINQNDTLIKNKFLKVTDKYLNNNFYSSSNDSLLIGLDTGSYVIHPIAPVYFQLCEDSITFAHNKYYDTVRIEIPLKPIVICPYLEVDISTPILRRCFDNTYSVHYCNQGTADAKGVYIEVELDKWLSYKSSSIPLKNQQGNLLTFDIGNLPIGECGDFQILTYLNCDSTILGQTHCTNAHIFPDSLCLPTNGWDGSRIRVSGQCLGDSIRFEIKNASNSPMLQQSNYIVVEDEIIMSKKPFQLGANETLKINIPVFGRTYRLEAEQSIGHPGSSKPTVTVENCGVGPVSLGFVNQFYQDDADPFIDIDCQQNRGSYDPNDKQGYPLGYGKNHFIEQNQSIEYHIRFQNTGSDTAFTVRIQDKLSNHLDPTTFVAGASSHPYSYRIFGNGIVEFLFDPIALPDSNVNNAKSIGFVKFTISQKKDLPIGSEIKNNALIYFDYNSPIVTNSTLHTVGKNFITITETSEVDPSSLKIYPNPFAQEAIIEVDNNDVDKIFELYDLYGRKIKEEKFVGNQLNFKRNHLQSGMYFFKITSKNKPLTQGKLIIH